MKGNILVVGANQTALVLAELLGKAGFDVTVVEKKARTEVSYDWHDSMSSDVFKKIGLPMPPKECYNGAESWAFIPPQKNDFLYLGKSSRTTEITIERKPLNDFLYNIAKDSANFRYETEAVKPIVEGQTVRGVELADGEKLYADLTVDVSGVYSVLREKLPAELEIQPRPDCKDVFFVRRTFFNINEGTGAPRYTHNLYMKHMGECGLSWFAFDENKKTADVLIGRVDRLEDETYNNALADLREENPQIGNTVLKGGQAATIPVRHPISKMVADGYVLLGDSAFMTFPMVGSGIDCGMYAAKILTDVLSEPQGNPFCIENLYRYQVIYMQRIGARDSGIDIMKNWLLFTPSDIIDFFMRKRIIGEKELNSGGGISLSKKDVFEKATKGIRHLPTLLKLKTTADIMKQQIEISSKIPEKYDEAAFKAWRKEYEERFAG